jgi:hypothetical protein
VRERERWGGCLCVLIRLQRGRQRSPHSPNPHPINTHHSAAKGETLASHTVGSALGFLLRLLTSWRTTVLVTYVAAEDGPQLAAPGPSTAKRTAAAGAANPQAWGEEVRTLLSAMLGKPKLASGLDDFSTFRQYWAAIRRGDAAAAARLADARDKI